MHEYSMIESLVRAVNDAAAERKAKKVNRVFLVMGENTHVAPDSVQMYFDMIAEGTAAQGAILEIRMVEAEMYCPACRENFRRSHLSFECPVCGAQGSPTKIGDEFYTERIEIEEAD